MRNLTSLTPGWVWMIWPRTSHSSRSVLRVRMIYSTTKSLWTFIEVRPCYDVDILGRPFTLRPPLLILWACVWGRKGFIKGRRDTRDQFAKVQSLHKSMSNLQTLTNLQSSSFDPSLSYPVSPFLDNLYTSTVVIGPGRTRSVRTGTDTNPLKHVIRME